MNCPTTMAIKPIQMESGGESSGFAAIAASFIRVCPP